MAPEHAKGHSVILVQVNGFGGDDPRGNLVPGVLDGIVADLHATIAERRLVRPAIIGHSMTSQQANRPARVNDHRRCARNAVRFSTLSHPSR